MISIDKRVWSAFWDGSPIGLAEVSAAGQFLKVNPMYGILLGYTQTEMEGMTWQEVTHPQDILPDQNAVNDLLLGKRRSYRMVKRYITKRGDSKWCEIHVFSVMDKESNQFDRFVVHCVPLPNGGRFIAQEEPSTGQVKIRPTIPLSEFIKDNWRPLVPIGITILSGLLMLFGYLREIGGRLGVEWP